MSGSGVVTVNGRPVFATYERTADGLRLDVQAAEWDGLEVAVGETAAVRLPGRPTAWLLVLATEPGAGGETAVRFVRPVAGSQERRPRPRM